MYSSGITATSTSSDTAVTLVTVSGPYNRLVISNTSANGGFFSVDGGTTWGFIPAGTASVPYTVEWWGHSTTSVKIKRIAGSGDITCYGYVDWINSN